MKLFVDLGAYTGDSIAEFADRDDAKEFDIFAFEPNPNMFNMLRILSRFEIVHAIPAAAWVKNEIRQFAVDTSKTPMGSTLMSSKAVWNESEKVDVECVDFSMWLADIASLYDYVIVKMDIEGAEFPVLEKMIKDNTDRLVDELWVEFHANKVSEYTTSDAENLKSRLRCKVVDWK